MLGGGSGRGCFFGLQLIRTMSSAWSCQPSELIRKCWSTPNRETNFMLNVYTTLPVLLPSAMSMDRWGTEVRFRHEILI